MSNLAESLRLIAVMIEPVMTETAPKMFEQLGLNWNDEDERKLAFNDFGWNTKVVEKPTPIFPRLKAEEEIKYIKDEMAKAKPKKTTRSEQKKTDEITIDDFDKVKIQVGQILSVEPVKGSSKLLMFKLDFGDGKERQILSGIRKFYPDASELLDKKIKLALVEDEHANGAELG